MRQLSNFVRRSLLTRWLCHRARLLLWLGRPVRARALLERVIVLRPSCVRAHFLLGRIAFDEGFRAEAVHKFAICHRLDPDLFRRQALPPALVREVTNRSVALADGPLTEGPPIHGDQSPDPDPDGWDDPLILQDPSWADLAETTDGSALEPDFRGPDEYHRFRDLPPIRPEDLDTVDIDDLLARLVEDPHPGEARDQG